MKNYILFIFCLVLFSNLLSCASTPKSKKVRSSKKGMPLAEQDPVEDDSGPVTVAGSKRTLVFSKSQNKLTSKRVDAKQAAEWGRELSGSLKKADYRKRLQFEAMVVAKTIGGSGFGDVLGAAKRLMKANLSKTKTAVLPDFTQLDLAIAAFRSGRYGMVSYFIAQALESKKRKVKAGAINLQGLLALQDGKLPEAAKYWTSALRVSSNYRAAKLNLGFLALKFGDYKTAKRMLSGMQSDWFALYGLIIAERLAENPGRVASLCASVMRKKEDYKPAMLSCALNKYQGKGDYKGAKKMLNKIVTMKSGGTYIDEIAYKALAQIEKDMSKQKAVANKAAQAKKAPIQKTKATKK